MYLYIYIYIYIYLYIYDLIFFATCHLSVSSYIYCTVHATEFLSPFVRFNVKKLLG